LDDAVALGRKAATIVCDDVQLMAGYAKAPSFARSSIAL
jgi:hypothetical protein